MAARELNRRLTSVDATFLYTEKPTLPMHVGGCMIYEGRLSLDALVEALNARLHLLPRYRQKVVFPPFGIAHPTWEDDPAFDIRNHAAEITLPAAGRRARRCPRRAGAPSRACSTATIRSGSSSWCTGATTGTPR